MTLIPNKIEIMKENYVTKEIYFLQILRNIIDMMYALALQDMAIMHMVPN